MDLQRRQADVDVSGLLAWSEGAQRPDCTFLQGLRATLERPRLHVRGGQTKSYFDISPPTLAEYLGDE